MQYIKTILLPIFLVFLFACHSPAGKENKASVSALSPDYLLRDSFILKSLPADHQKLLGVTGNFRSCKTYLDKLSNDSLTSIPFALDYITTCIPPGNADRDSIFLLFNAKFYAVTTKLSDSLYTKYNFLVDQLNKDSSSVELKCFQSNLTACGIKFLLSEGTYYLDAMSDFLYNNFKDRVSDGVKEYLSIRKDELKQGFSEDAGLLISFEDVYKRVKRWEVFIKNYPNTVCAEEANSYYITYLETLIAGMDNSRLFDFNSNSLLPEIKTLYEKIMKEETASPATKIISSYYSLLSRHNFKYNDSVDMFLKANDLSTMLAVQPQTR